MYIYIHLPCFGALLVHVCTDPKDGRTRMIGEWVKEKEETRETKNREKRETDDFTESENTYVYIYILLRTLYCDIYIMLPPS